MSDDRQHLALPDLGEGLTEAEIVGWLVKPGDSVELNQPIVEVETDKAIVEIPSPFAGRVIETHGEVGQRLRVGETLISFGTGPVVQAVSEPTARTPATTRPESEPLQTIAVQPKPATPLVRKLAAEAGVDIATIKGTGPGGRVTREDVLARAHTNGDPPAAGPGALEPGRPAAAGLGEERILVRGARRTIADKMVKSKFTIPHVTEWLQVDATELMRLRADLQRAPEARDVKLSPLPLIIKAMVVALRKHPVINSSFDEAAGEIVVKRACHVGVATDTERGLLVPVVRNADRFDVFQIAAEIGRLARAARDGKATPQELGGSTITVTNVGSFAVESATPIINHPEAAIIAAGAIAKRPWIVDGEVVPRDVMTLAITFDHRIIDGAQAGRFLRSLADLIETPARALAHM